MSTQSARLEVEKHLLASIPEEMGEVLRRSAYSANIKERRDYSCALFDERGRMLAQAAHIPVHLGAMPLSVQACLAALDLGPGDMALMNDPFRGGTHLPDLTLVAPVHVGGRRVGFVASRAHHADVGGMSPGSMPLATEVYQEGLIIPPVKLLEGGQVNESVLDLLRANVRTPEERGGDLRAQIAANLRGVERFAAWAAAHGVAQAARWMESLLAYSERVTRRLLQTLPAGTVRFEDALDDDGFGSGPVVIAAAVTIDGDRAAVDFTGSSPQQRGGVNATLAITHAAVVYTFRSLIGLDIPSNHGCLAPISIHAPPGTVVNARSPAAVAAGNVETSQRIVDVLLGALAQVCPDRIPAASQGTMNNLTIGRADAERGRAFTYYETIGGGAGAGPAAEGTSAVHSHMTNTMNTPAEALEFAYPLRVRRYQIRRGSGGDGSRRGGDGIVRELELLADAEVTILSDRRARRPYGLGGGGAGASGRNVLVRDGEEHELSGKTSLRARAGDVIRIETPGGGGYGEAGQPREEIGPSPPRG